MDEQEWQEEGEQFYYFFSDREGETWTLADVLIELRLRDFSEARVENFRRDARCNVGYGTPDSEVLLEL